MSGKDKHDIIALEIMNAHWDYFQNIKELTEDELSFDKSLDRAKLLEAIDRLTGPLV